jgi:hypothetical protein
MPRPPTFIDRRSPEYKEKIALIEALMRNALDEMQRQFDITMDKYESEAFADAADR